MDFAADRADLSLEGADMGVRTMSKAPASIALWNTRAAVCRGDDEMMYAVHEVVAHKVTKVKTHTRVGNIKPNGAGIRTSAV